MLSKKTTAALYALHQQNKPSLIPPTEKAIVWFNDLLQLFFPSCNLCSFSFEQRLLTNKNLFTSILFELSHQEEQSEEGAALFYKKLPQTIEHLYQDAEEIFNHDPAANSVEEVIHSYPGFLAITAYRIAHLIHQKLNIPLLPRLISEYAHSKTGIDIHPAAKIAVPFFIDHGTGIVIGATTCIGKHVKIYQGVTLGALQVHKSMADKKRHPNIEDHVIIYANATILGGETTIGSHSIIGGNVFLTNSIKPHSLVIQKNEIKVIDKKER